MFLPILHLVNKLTTKKINKINFNISVVYVPLVSCFSLKFNGLCINIHASNINEPEEINKVSS